MRRLTGAEEGTLSRCAPFWLGVDVNVTTDKVE